MRVMATGDNHFDESKRFDECIRVHEWINEQVEQHRPHLFCLTGDIFERKSTPVERLAVAAFLLRLAEVCPVLMVRGNHDEDLEIFEKLRGKHPIVIEQRAGVHRFKCAGVDGIVEDLTVGAMAWPSIAHLRASGVDERAALEGVLRGFENDAPQLVVGHWMIDGSEASTGQPLIGHTLNVGLADLALTSAPLILAGHIHKAQAWNFGGSHIRYCGSPYRCNYGELEDKSIVLADWKGTAWDVRTLETPARDMQHCSALWTGSDWEWNEHPSLLTGDAGVEYRFRYSVAPDHRESAREAADKLRAHWLRCGAHSVKVEEQIIATKRARAPEVSRAVTLADKLDAHWRSTGFEPGGRRDTLIEKAGELETDAA